MGYTINEDGSVTRDRVPNPRNTSNSNNNRNGGNEDNNGCLWGIVIAIIIGINAVVNSNRSTSNSVYEVADSTVCDTAEYYADTAATDYSCNNSYLSVSPSSVTFDSNGGSKTFSVNSSGSWRITTNTYAWGHLAKNGNQLILRVDPNTSCNQRTDYFKIKAGNIEKTVNIIQSGKSSNSYNSNSARVSGNFRNIWVDYNVTDSYGNKGMRIHIKFDINGMLNRTGQVAAYFYYANGNPLKDTNDSYRTLDGNVATHVNFTPNYENSTFNDLSIFMPSSELHLSQTTSCYFTISIWDGNTEVVRSGINSFQITF